MSERFVQKIRIIKEVKMCYICDKINRKCIKVAIRGKSHIKYQKQGVS